jgi:hypothetical protein
MEATELATPLSTTVSPRDFGGLLPAAPGLSELTIQVLKMPEERLIIAPLRKYADFESEYELDPGMAAFEKTKDKIGIVMAIFQDGLPIATIRFIPGGHGVTLTERYWGHLTGVSHVLGPHNWERTTGRWAAWSWRRKTAGPTSCPGAWPCRWLNCWITPRSNISTPPASPAWPGFIAASASRCKALPPAAGARTAP